MSLKLNERYPARFNNPTAGYPQGSFKNRTTPTAKDGSYLEKDWANDKEGFFQSLLSAAGITANGSVDAVGASQFFDALQALKQLQSGTAFTTAGSAGALTLTPNPAISAYSAPLRFRVKFSQNSTGNDTINVSGKGAKNLKQYDSSGVKISAVFSAGQVSDAEYDGADFILLNQLPSTTQATETVTGGGKVATQSKTNAGTDDATIVTPKKLRWGFSISLTTNGYVVFPTWLGGLIFQWGISAQIPNNTTVSVPLPMAYPTACLCAIACTSNPSSAQAGADGVVNISAISTTAIGIFSNDNSSGTTALPGAYHFSIGY